MLVLTLIYFDFSNVEQIEAELEKEYEEDFR